MSLFARLTACFGQLRQSFWQSFFVVALVLGLAESSRGIVIPTLALYIQHVSGGVSDAVVSLVVGGFSVGRLAASAFFAWWLTKSGEDKANIRDMLSGLLLSMFVVLAGHFLYLIASLPQAGIGTLFILILARILTGFGTGVLTIARTFVGDQCSAVQKVKFMSWLGVIQFVGFSITPAIGGINVDFHVGELHVNTYTFGTYLLMFCTALTILLLLKISPAIVRASEQSKEMQRQAETEQLNELFMQRKESIRLIRSLSIASNQLQSPNKSRVSSRKHTLVGTANTQQTHNKMSVASQLSPDSNNQQLTNTTTNPRIDMQDATSESNLVINSDDVHSTNEQINPHTFESSQFQAENVTAPINIPRPLFLSQVTDSSTSNSVVTSSPIADAPTVASIATPTTTSSSSIKLLETSLSSTQGTAPEIREHKEQDISQTYAPMTTKTSHSSQTFRPSQQQLSQQQQAQAQVSVTSSGNTSRAKSRSVSFHDQKSPPQTPATPSGHEHKVDVHNTDDHYSRQADHAALLDAFNQASHSSVASEELLLTSMPSPQLIRTLSLDLSQTMSNFSMLSGSGDHTPTHALSDVFELQLETPFSRRQHLKRLRLLCWVLITMNGIVRGCLGVAETYGTLLYISVYESIDENNDVVQDASEFFFILGIGGVAVFLSLDMIQQYISANVLLTSALSFSCIGYALLMNWGTHNASLHQVTFIIGMTLIWSLASPIVQTIISSNLSLAAQELVKHEKAQAEAEEKGLASPTTPYSQSQLTPASSSSLTTTSSGNSSEVRSSHNINIGHDAQQLALPKQALTSPNPKNKSSSQAKFMSYLTAAGSLGRIFLPMLAGLFYSSNSTVGTFSICLVTTVGILAAYIYTLVQFQKQGELLAMPTDFSAAIQPWNEFIPPEKHGGRFI